MSKPSVELLKKIRGYLVPSPYSDLLYRTPAAALRKAANDLEEKEKAIAELDKLIEYLDEHCTCNQKTL